MSWNFRIKFLQALCYIGGPLVLIFNWNTELFLGAWAWHWVAGALGVSIGFHRCFSHGSFEPKNNIIKALLHFFGVISVVGSSITWTGTHRMHHRYSDTDLDPHCVEGKDTWTRIKYWFNYWPAHTVEMRYVRNLIKDPMGRFFHRYYFHILFAWMALLALISIDVFLYGFLVSTMFTLHIISWITVGAHIFGNSPNPVDSSKNTVIMGLYMWGEGYHNNHHVKPWAFDFGWGPKQPDLGKWVIQLIGKNLQYSKQEKPIRYSRNEQHLVN